MAKPDSPASTDNSPPPPLLGRSKSSPPINDCCPICFDDFSVPCRSNCDHWFCATCILEFWHYGASLKPCKCPFCLRSITSLSPEATLLSSKNLEVSRVLKNVDKYNSLYAGGASGMIMKVRTLPSVIKRCLLDMSDPTRRDYYYCIVRCIALFLSLIYMAGSFDFLPIGFLSTPRFFELCGLIFMGLVQMFGILHRYWLRRRARNLAADAFPQ
uniref:RING-type domain-containing protein n=1 Tax=Kalanchoe fedtschenkoi TaxID=63787 RepID=A0A7N0UDZ5_KALFE